MKHEAGESKAYEMKEKKREKAGMPEMDMKQKRMRKGKK